MANKSTPTPESEALKKHTRLVRAIEANLRVENPDAEELRFRDSLINCIIATLPAMSQFTIRIYEAAAEVKFASESVIRLRKALQHALGKEFGLASFRQAS